MAGKPYHVVPDDNGWAVKREGASRASSTHNKKNAAIKQAKKTAVRNDVGVIVHRGDGTVGHGYDIEQLKRSYPRLAKK